MVVLVGLGGWRYFFRVAWGAGWRSRGRGGDGRGDAGRWEGGREGGGGGRVVVEGTAMDGLVGVPDACGMVLVWFDVEVRIRIGEYR